MCHRFRGISTRFGGYAAYAEREGKARIISPDGRLRTNQHIGILSIVHCNRCHTCGNGVPPASSIPPTIDWSCRRKDLTCMLLRQLPIDGCPLRRRWGMSQACRRRLSARNALVFMMIHCYRSVIALGSSVFPVFLIARIGDSVVYWRAISGHRVVGFTF